MDLEHILRGLRNAYNARANEPTREVMLCLAHAVRSLDSTHAEAHIQTCRQFELINLMRLVVSRFGVSSYESKLALCTCANLSEAGGAVLVRSDGGLRLIEEGLAAEDNDVRYLAVAALRNQLAADDESHALVRGHKAEALLTMMISSKVDARTLDSATSALNNLHSFHGDKALSMGAPPPLPPGISDSMARHSWGPGSSAITSLETMAQDKFLAEFLAPDASAVVDLPPDLNELMGLSSHARAAPAAAAADDSPGDEGTGVAENGGATLSESLSRLFGGALTGPSQADDAKMRLLLKANIRRRFVVCVWSANLLQAAWRGHRGRLTVGPLRQKRREQIAAAAIQDVVRERLRWKASKSIEAAAVEAQRVALERIGAGLTSWVLRARGKALKEAVRELHKAQQSTAAAMTARDAQLGKLQKMRSQGSMDEAELRAAEEGVHAAVRAFQGDLPAAQSRVAFLTHLLHPPVPESSSRGRENGIVSVPL